jgi:high-affinity iron transporter
MLPTFVIGLREGLEAALIVGIIAAFLRKQGRRDLLRSVLLGVGVAIGLCVAAGVALDLYSRNLPQRQQEGLETVIGVLAVGMVTYMVIWMRRNSRRLKGQLEGLAADALAGSGPGQSGAGRAMVLMAFLAVIREGLETVVFLLAAFNESGSGSAAGFGAVSGIAVAVALGYGIYRGGVRLNLSKFFRATGLVLVLVAAGLVVNALHTAHEAGWLNAGQGATVDLTWLVEPGTVQASLLTGMLGIQPRPVVVEVVGWLVYLIPVGCYVAWPPGRAVPGRALARVCAGVGLLAGMAAIVLGLVRPGPPTVRSTAGPSTMATTVTARSGPQAVVRTVDRQPVLRDGGQPIRVTLGSQGETRHAGLRTEVFRAMVPGGRGAADRPSTLDATEVAALNNGRMPIGVPPGTAALDLTYRDVRTLTIWLDTRTDRVIDVAWSEAVTATAQAGNRVFALTRPVATARTGWPTGAVAQAVAAAGDAHRQLERRSILGTLAGWSAVLAAAALLAAAGFALAARRRPETTPVAGRPAEALLRS